MIKNIYDYKINLGSDSMNFKTYEKPKSSNITSSKLNYDQQKIGERNKRNRYEGEASTYEAHYTNKAEYPTTKTIK